jgi:hypothetical protein
MRELNVPPMLWLARADGALYRAKAQGRNQSALRRAAPQGGATSSKFAA